MGLLKFVSGVVLVCVLTLLRDNDKAAHAAPTSDPFVRLDANDLQLPIECMAYTKTYMGPSRCLYPAPIRFKENATGPVFSFSTQFLVALWQDLPRANQQSGYGGSARNVLEGFTFAMLPHPNASRGGNGGGYLGLLNATSNGDPQSHIFAVEFDFVKSPQFSDPDEGFHIGVDVNSMNSTSWALLQGSENSGQVWNLQVWIEYDASLQILNVSTFSSDTVSCPLSDKQRPGGMTLTPFANKTTIPYNSLSLNIDLSNVLNEFMYVGFTSNSLPWHFQLGNIGSGFWSLRTSNYTSPADPSDPLPCYSPWHLSLYEQHPFEVKLALVLVSLTAAAAIYALLYKRYSGWVERRGWRFTIDPDDLGAADPHKFTYRELALATKNFDPKQALGRGGFGSVYKGFLPGNQQHVAVKRVAPDSSQGEREFMAEVMIIGKIRHRNLVRLQGWCHERGELLLVYDYMPQGSLDKLLFGSPEELPSARDQQELAVSVTVDGNVVEGFPWERRFKVIVDVAMALVYLHYECEERIIHRDVKAANVMLDANFNARLGDFGLARSYKHSLLTPESTNVAGTFGYLAPELYQTGKQTEQTDVYSFGAFLLEVACGRKPIFHEDGEVILLLEHVWRMWGSLQILDAADPRLAGRYNAHEMTKALCLGLLCSHPSPAMRPSMRQVLLILQGDLHLPEVPLSKPQFDYFPRSGPYNLSWTTNPRSKYYTASATGEEST